MEPEPAIAAHTFHPVNLRRLMDLDERVGAPRECVEGPTRSDVFFAERHAGGPYSKLE